MTDKSSERDSELRQLSTKSPEPRKKSRDPVAVHVAHFSMQYSDPLRQQKADASVIFSRGYDWITGTEAGAGDPLAKALRVQAHDNGYHLHVFVSNWIAVRRDFVKRGTFRKGGEIVVDRKVAGGRGSHLNVALVEFENEEIGEVTVLASHYRTKGRPNASPAYSVNLKWNIKLAEAIGRLTEKHGAGHRLAFYGGDQNIIDRKEDTFFGEPLTSVWDELEKWDNTGHGNIDVIASYDRDGRVVAHSARALDDSELPMFTDHFPIEAAFLIQPVR